VNPPNIPITLKEIAVPVLRIVVGNNSMRSTFAETAARLRKKVRRISNPIIKAKELD
jgi:hypothetical protein